MVDNKTPKHHFMITYDLNTGGYDYLPLFNEIKTLGPWYHPLERMWIVYSEFNKDVIVGRLQSRINLDKDRLFVAEVNSTTSQGWLGTKFWEWFNSEK